MDTSPTPYTFCILLYCHSNTQPLQPCIASYFPGSVVQHGITHHHTMPLYLPRSSPATATHAPTTHLHTGARAAPPTAAHAVRLLPLVHSSMADTMRAVALCDVSPGILHYRRTQHTTFFYLGCFAVALSERRKNLQTPRHYGRQLPSPFLFHVPAILFLAFYFACLTWPPSPFQFILPLPIPQPLASIHISFGLNKTLTHHDTISAYMHALTFCMHSLFCCCMLPSSCVSLLPCIALLLLQQPCICNLTPVVCIWIACRTTSRASYQTTSTTAWLLPSLDSPPLPLNTIKLQHHFFAFHTHTFHIAICTLQHACLPCWVLLYLLLTARTVPCLPPPSHSSCHSCLSIKPPALLPTFTVFSLLLLSSCHHASCFKLPQLMSSLCAGVRHAIGASNAQPSSLLRLGPHSASAARNTSKRPSLPHAPYSVAVAKDRRRRVRSGLMRR